MQNKRALVQAEKVLEWDLVDVESGPLENQRVLNLVERKRKLEEVWGVME